MTIVMALAAFLFSSVAAYMAGLVGSSSNPVSGVTIATIMVASLLLVLFMGTGHPAGPAATLVIGAVVCCAAAMGGDNLQDLKTGHLVGSTPWKQQIMQVVGVLTGAVVLVPVLSLLQAKYGIGEPTIETSSSAQRATSDADGQSHAQRLRRRAALAARRIGRRHRRTRHCGGPQTGSARQRVSSARPCRGAGHLSCR